MMLDKALFGQAIVRLRGERSQRSVARRAGISIGTYCQWELGKRQPRKAQIPKICRGLDCTEEEIEATMWHIQAERFKLKGSDVEAPTLEALSECQEQITAVLQTHFKHLSPDLRPLLIRLRVSLRETGEKLMAVNADFEALVVALGQPS